MSSGVWQDQNTITAVSEVSEQVLKQVNTTGLFYSPQTLDVYFNVYFYYSSGILVQV